MVFLGTFGHKEKLDYQVSFKVRTHLYFYIYFFLNNFETEVDETRCLLN